MISLGILSKLWGLSWVRGTALSVGVLVAVVGNGWLQGRIKYREGRKDERTVMQAAWDADAALARASALKVKMHADSLTSALRDSITAQSKLVARLSEARARAQGQYAQALEAYNALKALSGDSVPPEMVTACDAIAATCSNALAAAEHEKDGLVMQLRTAEALAVAQSDAMAREPERWKPVIADALSEQRRGFHAPSRTKWAAAGTVLGLAACLVPR
jgi:hypothetical protein